MDTNIIIQGDCLEVMKTLPDNSVDSVVTDPPYGLTSMTRPRTDEIAVNGNDGKGNPFCRKQAVGGFMGKQWDGTGIENNIEMWKEVFRVLKPGGHLLSFGGTRTYHRMAVAIEDAGFEVRDMIEWVYGSGFPKSLSVDKDIDEQYFEREARKYPEYVSKSDEFSKTKEGRASRSKWQKQFKIEKGLCRQKIGDNKNHRTLKETNCMVGEPHSGDGSLTNPFTLEAKQWEGWGTALKPAHEPICMARKPMAEKSVAENCLKWGTGGINIDESRVGTEARINSGGRTGKNPYQSEDDNLNGKNNLKTEVSGRFPANLIHDNSEEVRECFPEANHKTGSSKGAGFQDSFVGGKADGGIELPRYDDSGNASRFFKSILYYPKASKSERNKGCDGLEEKVSGHRSNFRCRLCGYQKASGTPCKCENPIWEEIPLKPQSNNHPTVKPIALMEYLIKMITPKGGIVLDPFAGSGSTLIAAKQNGFKFIGIEKEAEYVKIAEARLSATRVDNKLF